jgi:hypothetical protein
MSDLDPTPSRDPIGIPTPAQTRRICVYCGSRDGASPTFALAARALAEALVARRVGLIYGGASVGLMGILADRTLALGGEAIGVIPRLLVDKELAHQRLSQLIVTDSMHDRKLRMAALADGFLALPGGAGTLDELFEIWTWSLLGLHDKPIGLLNLDGYYTPLLQFLDGAVAAGFLAPRQRALLYAEGDLPTLLDRLLAPPTERGIQGLPSV